MWSSSRFPLGLVLAALMCLPGVGAVAQTGAQTGAQTEAFRATRLSEPEPSFAEPRKVMLQLTSRDETAINNILSNAINIQAFYGMDNVEIAIVAFGAGMEALYAETSPVQDRILSLQKYNIAFVGCGNTMEATDREPAELIDGVTYVQAGIAEIVERQLDGWVYIRP